MPILRLEIQKSGAVSFLSHLDYVEALQRALRRSGLPVAYSQGFNPHMKVSFGAALAVGVSSLGEWADVEITRLVSENEVETLLRPMLSESMALRKYQILEEKPKALSNLIEAASYQAEWKSDVDLGNLQQILNEVGAQEEIPWEIISPKRRKIMDIRKEIVELSLNQENEKVILVFWLKLTPLGSLKPTIFLQYLESMGFLSFEKAQIIRTGLWRCVQGKWVKI